MTVGIVTDRDRATVGFVAAHPWVVSEHVRRFLSLDTPEASGHVAGQVARRRLLVLVGHGLVSHGTLRLFGVPLSAYWLTRRGAHFLGQERPRGRRHPPTGSRCRRRGRPPGVAPPRSARHLGCSHACQRSQPGNLPDGLLVPLGGREVHIPDLVARLKDGRRMAFEVEMSRKSPRRLAEIMRAYRLARGLDAVTYLTPNDARAAAIARAAHGVSKVSVIRLDRVVPMASWPRT